MLDRDLCALVDDEFAAAIGRPSGDISTERAKAWNYYLSKPLGNEVDGESQVVASVVSDVVDGIMPSLVRIFTTADNLITFDPVGPEDVRQAEQESDFVTHEIFKQDDTFELLHTWFFDALVQKNGVVMAWWDESEVVTTENYTGLTLDEVRTLLDDPELEPVERAEREPNPDEIAGADGLVHDIEFRRTRTSGQLCIENVPPEEYRISADAKRLNPSKARMVGHETEKTRTELLEMGFDKDLIDSIPAYLQSSSRQAGFGHHGSNEEQARYDRSDERWDSSRAKSTDLIRVRECWMRCDYDEDGKAELRHILLAGSEVLINEPADRQPFHVITPQPLPHKHFGRASAEKVMDLHEIVTTLMRQMLMNLYHTNNPGHAVWDQATTEDTYDDLMTNRIGSIKRFSRPVAEAYAPMTVPFTAGATLPMLDVLERAKRDRTGISGDGQTLSPEALKNIQQSVMAQATDQALAKIEFIARAFAETGMRSLFQHVRELLMKHSEKASLVRLRNQWVPIDPRSWRERKNVTVHIGVGLGTRDTRRATLLAIAEKQAQIVQGGGLNLLVTPQNVYNTMADLVKNENVGDPQRHFTDPQGQLAPPPSEQEQRLQAQQQQLIERQQQLDAAEMAVREGKLELDRQRTLFETDRKMAEFEHKKQVDNAKLMLEAQEARAKLVSARNADEIARREQDLKEAVARVEAVLTRAQAAKAGEEARAQDIENDATESGMTEALEGLIRMQEREEPEADG